MSHITRVASHHVTPPKKQRVTDSQNEPFLRQIAPTNESMPMLVCKLYRHEQLSYNLVMWDKCSTSVTSGVESCSMSLPPALLLNLWIFLVNCGQSQTFRRRPISTMIYPLSNNFYNHLSKIIFATALHTLSPLEDWFWIPDNQIWYIYSMNSYQSNPRSLLLPSPRAQGGDRGW